MEPRRQCQYPLENSWRLCSSRRAVDAPSPGCPREPDRHGVYSIPGKSMLGGPDRQCSQISSQTPVEVAGSRRAEDILRPSIGGIAPSKCAGESLNESGGV